MCTQEVIPSVAVFQVGRLTVDGDVSRFIAFHTHTCCGIELYQADEAEVGAVATP